MELQDSKTAKKLIKTIKTNIESLRELPYRYSPLKDPVLSAKGIRKLLIDKHIIFYIISEKKKTVTIIRVFHAMRNWEHLL